MKDYLPPPSLRLCEGVYRFSPRAPSCYTILSDRLASNDGRLLYRLWKVCNDTKLRFKVRIVHNEVKLHGIFGFVRDVDKLLYQTVLPAMTLKYATPSGPSATTLSYSTIFGSSAMT